MNRLAKHNMVKRHTEMMALHAQCRAEVAPILKAMRQADDALDGKQSARGIDSQGYTFALGKYGARICTMHTPSGNDDLASANDALHAARVQGDAKAEREYTPKLV